MILFQIPDFKFQISADPESGIWNLESNQVLDLFPSQSRHLDWVLHPCQAVKCRANDVVRIVRTEDLGANIVHAQALQHGRSEEHTSELQSRFDLVCRLLL